MNKSRMALACLGAALGLAASSPAAVLITFDNYSAGDLVGQPASGSKWSGTAARFEVDGSIGEGGGAGVISSLGATANTSVSIAPTAAEVGGIWGTDNTRDLFVPGRGIVSTNITSDLYRVFIGSSARYVAGIAIRGNGNLTVNSAGLSIDGLFADKEYHTISVVADYTGAGTYSLSVDGTQKQTGAFYDIDPAFATYGGFQLNVRAADTDNNRMPRQLRDLGSLSDDGGAGDGRRHWLARASQAARSCVSDWIGPSALAREAHVVGKTEVVYSPLARVHTWSSCWWSSGSSQY